MGPDFILTTASAGSGKTYELSLRFAEFLLAKPRDNEAPRGLSNILAITFTRNAAREMKVRILEWLKEGYRAEGDKAEKLRARLNVDPAGLSRRAEEAVERILEGYTDFRVDTIDSFAASVFRASAVDLGYGPDFEISLNPRELLDYAFARHLRRVAPDSEEGERFRRILDYLLLQEGDKSRYLWDPAPKIGEKLASFLNKLAGRTGELVLDDFRREKAEIGKKIRAISERLKQAVEASGLDVTTTGHYAKKILPAVEAGDFSGLIDCSFKTFPVKGSAKAKGAAAVAVEKIEAAWTELQRLVREYARRHARDFFLPYLQAYRAVQEEMGEAKRRRGLLFLDDVNRELYRYLDRGIIPDVYFRLGDRIYHYLIDEFQDTSPIQWAILRPLIEESLGRGGSLFLVGDRKQAIYGFRDADFRIMSRLENGDEVFDSVPTTVRELAVNYRSEGEIQAFVKDLFLGLKRSATPEEAEDDEVDYGRLAGLSGLNAFEQDVLPERKDRGYVRYILLDQGGQEKTGDGPVETDEAVEDGTESGRPEKKEIQNLVEELVGRGFAWSDIAVLASRNDEVADVASWLNEKSVEIVSFSSLDIRRRKVIGDILSFLRFLDSPPDDLAFAGFLLGDLFSKVAGGKFDQEARREFLRACHRDGARPSYTSLRRRFPGLWTRFFEPMFNSVGYLPLYDLATRIYREFDVFRLFPDEEAALTKLLEAIKGFEGEGKNDLREFLEFSAGEEDPDGIWTIDVPRETEAVRIMSIHKAKGATIPVVICLLYGQAFKGDEFYLEEDDQAGVHIYKINKTSAAMSEDLAQIYGEAKDREWVDRLNSLYVALTRAEYELYLVGVKKKKTRYPFDLLGRAFETKEDDPESQEDLPRRVFERGNSARLEFYRPPENGGQAGDSGNAGLRQEVDHRSGFNEPGVDIRESLDPSGIRRGEWIHRILAGIEVDRAGWKDEVAAALAALEPSSREAALAGEAAAALFRAPGRSIDPAWFEARPGRRIAREFDVCDAAGDVHRMDRVVLDPESVLVIDFKTGRRPQFLEEYREQIRGYRRLLSDVFPGRTVRGFLAFLDQDRIEEVP
ncbi:MAG: UvrD-helicase domain-containing protein [Candidatus Aminicenantes bacterium]|nr:UvrD-helicase domain-containing protein [Candidatus Aminicenantes bacterium]